MRIFLKIVIAFFGIGLLISPALAQSTQQERMKSCNAEARDKKLSGKPRKDFLSDCLSAKTTTPVNPQRQKMTDCTASAATQKLSGAARRKFMSSCLSGSGQASPQVAPTSAPAPTAAPTSPRERTTAPVNPQRQKMTECNASAAAQKLSGAARRKFISSCLSGDSPQAAPTTAPAPTASPPARTTSPVNAQRQKMTECNASAATQKLSGAARRKFMSSCLSGDSPQAAPTTTPAPTTTTAPTTQPSTTPPSTPTSAAPTGAGQHATEMQAKLRCPLDTVVWVNLNSRIYHFKGTSNYGTTKSGAYMCEKDATAAGSRAAKNEKRP